ncbi:MAG: acyltransferase 3 [Bacteroidetes bacterium]|nr:acyltransferase 3 [Bacteroidota bacterium]
MEIRQLTFTRFVAALMILIFHYGQHAFPFNSGLLQHFAKEGAFAVSYFFCLSGYILAHVYYKTDRSKIDKKEFYLKRFARIYPLYFFGFFMALISGFFLYHSIPKGNSIILQMLGLHAWVPGICLEINFPAWSLSVELFFYLYFPFLLRFFEQVSTKKILFFTITIWVISAIIHILMKSADHGDSRSWGEFMLYNPLFHMNTFIVGMAGATIVNRHKINWNNSVSTIVFLGSCTLLFLIIATDNPILPWIHNGLLAPLFVLIIISLQFTKKGISSVFSLKPLVFLGNISYAIYILQHPVAEWFSVFMILTHFKASTTIIFYFYLIALILISALAFLCIEKPLRKRITQIISTK